MKSVAQVPVADFSVYSEACRNESLRLVNTSTNATRYEWDFCLQDIFSLSGATETVSISGLSWGSSYRLVEADGMWYGFVCSFNNSVFYRLDFGDKPTNIPTITNLGNFSGQLVLPFDTEIVYNNGTWFGFISSYDVNAGVLMLSFGASLKNIPTITNLGRFGINTRYLGVKAVKQKNDNLLVLLAGDPRSLVVVNFRDSFYNSITQDNISNTGFLSSNPPGFDVINVNGNWIGLLTNAPTNEILKLNFGPDLTSVPFIESAYSFSGIQNPTKVKILQEGSSYYGIISGSNSVATIDFKDMSPSVVPEKINQSTLPILYGIDVIRWKGKSIIQGVSDSNNKLSQIVFDCNCDATFPYSEDFNPVGLNFASQGGRKIELRVFDNENQTSQTSLQINISSNVSPDISFDTDGKICSDHDINFKPESSYQDLTDYSWSFGDTQNSIDSNPTHQYSSAGDYEVSLQVIADNGCSNYIKKNIKIFDPPNSLFSAPSGLLCTNNAFQFTNNTVDNFDGNLTYEWYVNDELKSTQRDFNYAFAQTGDQMVKLKTTIPGCYDEAIQTLPNVQSGPMVEFSMAGKCEDEIIYFNNQSTGDIAGYSWDLGDGLPVTTVNPTRVYDTYGNYPITLNTSGTNGCVSRLTKNLIIYSKPQPDFRLELPPLSCAGTPSQFTDLTPPMPDSNVASWQWTFGDGSGGSGNTRNPLYTYPQAGNYVVGLTATTNFGCSNNIQKSITIAPAPAASFNINNACLNGSATVFSNLSSGSIKAYRWQLDGKEFATKDVNYLFKTPGSYNTRLIVTGNNNCQGIQEKSVLIPIKPTFDFEVNKPCVGEGTVFTAVDGVNTDAAQSWNWVFNGDPTSGQTATYNFSTTGSQPVFLESTRNSGCRYMITKSVNIIEAPEAGFSVGPWSVGEAPFEVGFTNLSKKATRYTWQFDDVTPVVSSISPTHTFFNLGTYKVALTALNNEGCDDTFIQPIQVVVAAIDAELESFKLNRVAGNTKLEPIVTIKNESNVIISDPEIVITLDGETSFSEILSGSLTPGEIKEFKLNAKLLTGNADYVCADIVLARDQESYNNKQCLSETDDWITLAPYPNPATDKIMLAWVSAHTEPVEVLVFNSFGQVVFGKKYEDVLVGLNQVLLSLEDLHEGTYFIRFQAGTKRYSYPVSVIR